MNILITTRYTHLHHVNGYITMHNMTAINTNEECDESTFTQSSIPHVDSLDVLNHDIHFEAPLFPFDIIESMEPNDLSENTDYHQSNRVTDEVVREDVPSPDLTVVREQISESKYLMEDPLSDSSTSETALISLDRANHMEFNQEEAPLFPFYITDEIEANYSQYESMVDSSEYEKYLQTEGSINEDHMYESTCILPPPFHNVNDIYSNGTFQGQEYDDTGIHINDAELVPLQYQQNDDDIGEHWREDAVSPDFGVLEEQVIESKHIFPTLASDTNEPQRWINPKTAREVVESDIAVQRLQLHEIKFPTPTSLDLNLDDLHSDEEYQVHEYVDVDEQMQTFHQSLTHEVQPPYNWGMANEQLDREQRP